MKRPFSSIATSSNTQLEESEEEEEMNSSSEEEDSDDSIDSDEEEEIERELAEVTFEELQKARADDSEREIIFCFRTTYQLKERIKYQDKQLKFESAKNTDAEILAAHKKKEKEAAKHGKRPFHLKKSEIRNQRLIEKYKMLKASGKLESFIEKKRRKNAAN